MRISPVWRSLMNMRIFRAVTAATLLTDRLPCRGNSLIRQKRGRRPSAANGSVSGNQPRRAKSRLHAYLVVSARDLDSSDFVDRDHVLHKL
jgi:hypothetical protein